MDNREAMKKGELEKRSEDNKEGQASSSQRFPRTRPSVKGWMN